MYVYLTGKQAKLGIRTSYLSEDFFNYKVGQYAVKIKSKCSKKEAKMQSKCSQIAVKMQSKCTQTLDTYFLECLWSEKFTALLLFSLCMCTDIAVFFIS